MRTIQNGRSIVEAVGTQDEAVRAIQDEVERIRSQGIRDQVEAKVSAVIDGSPGKEVRRFVFRAGETKATEVKPIRNTSGQGVIDRAY